MQQFISISTCKGMLNAEKVMELNGGECHTLSSKTGKQQCAMLKLPQTLESVSKTLQFIIWGNISCLNFAYEFMIFQSINKYKLMRWSTVHVNSVFWN